LEDVVLLGAVLFAMFQPTL